MFWDRRKKDRREKAAKAAPGEERRDKPEKSDRRRWTSGVLYKTSIPVTEIETWLEDNAEERWSVALDGIESSLSVKVLKIMFESLDDKNAFIQAFSKRN